MVFYKKTDWRKYKDFLMPVGVVFFFLLVVVFLGQFINSLPFWIQFLFIGVPVTFVLMHSLGKKIGGWRFVFALLFGAISVDLITPPYLIDFQGNINSTVYWAGTSSDFFVGTIFSKLGISGFPLFVFTYFIGFLIIFGSAMLLVWSSRQGKNSGGFHG